MDKNYRTESEAANTPVKEKAALNPYLNAVNPTLTVGGDEFKLKITGTKAKKFTSTQNMINMGSRTIYGYFDAASAKAFRDRINKYRSEFFGNSDWNLLFPL